ncbi:hypothetical protein VPH35_065444 [Triticum aestivum]
MGVSYLSKKLACTELLHIISIRLQLPGHKPRLWQSQFKFFSSGYSLPSIDGLIVLVLLKFFCHIISVDAKSLVTSFNILKLQSKLLSFNILGMNHGHTVLKFLTNLRYQGGHLRSTPSFSSSFLASLLPHEGGRCKWRRLWEIARPAAGKGDGTGILGGGDGWTPGAAEVVLTKEAADSARFGGRLGDPGENERASGGSGNAG